MLFIGNGTSLCAEEGRKTGHTLQIMTSWATVMGSLAALTVAIAQVTK
jgi:hypothetical protein